METDIGSVEVFRGPSDSSNRSTSLGGSTEDELSPKLVLDDVEITPGYMHFDNAYEGKHFSQKLVIQNCGAHLAFVRLGEPNSKSFDFRSFIGGHFLSPGLKIVRTVNYVYRGTIAVCRGFAPIYVNDNMVNYHFKVTLSAAILSLWPQELDFGRIDAVNVATLRTLQIRNSGFKGTQFAIDLGRNELEIMVEPMRGTVPAKSSVLLRVEIVGCKEGDFLEEFWVKAAPPLRVIVSGTFISPKLVVRKFISGLDFTLMDFQPTYFGSRTTRPLLIKNSSSSHSMFCVMADIKGSAMPVEEARKIDENFADFDICPTDGRLAAEKGSVIQITFAPKKNTKKEKNYAACFLKVIRMDCRDVENFSDDIGQLTEIANKSRETMGTLATISKDKLNDDIVMSTETLTYSDLESQFSFEHAIGVCLYGEKQRPRVDLKPTLITLEDLVLDKTYDRVVYVENRSRLLPIVVRYSKTASIEVFPNQFHLRPFKGQEIRITIKPFKLGDVSKKLCFDLLATDFPEDRYVLRKVGTASISIHLNVNNVTKNSRLEQCLLCYDLPLKLAPEFALRRTPSELARKAKNDSFYLTYIQDNRERREGARVFTGIEDYDLTNSKHLNRQQVSCQNPPARPPKIVSYSKFTPLTPKQLYNIKISPKSMRLKKVAAYTSITEYFFIHNTNTWPIRVHLRASKSCVQFLDEARYVVRGGEKKKVPFIFSTTVIGRYYVNINVLINDSTLYEVAAVAHVVPKTLKMETNEINFLESDGHYKFFSLINNLNASTTYSWDVPSSCFQIYPTEGDIKAECFITSVVRYEPDPAQPNVTDCTLISESGQKKIVQLSFKRRFPCIVFDTYSIDFGLIPLNILVRRRLIMKNEKDFKVPFTVSNSVPIPGVSIEPTAGMLLGKDSQVFIISVCLNAMIEFSTTIVFTIDEDMEFKVALSGVVDFPKFILIPDMLPFRKIAPHAFDTLAFKVKNVSKCECYITFPLEDFPEFTITEHEEIQFPHKQKLVLQPHEAKVLFLHFHPDYVSTYTFALPYVINGVLGPPNLNSDHTSNSHYYLQPNAGVYESVAGVTVLVKIPGHLPLVRITCSAFEKFLEFSRHTINFVYFGEGHYSNEARSDFEITNTSPNSIRVCIRIDDLLMPFSLVLKSDKDIEYYDVSYMMELEPGEKIVFEAGFQPQDLGIYSVKLPIFVRHYHDNKIFNYLTLEGVYGKPTITPSCDRFDFEPVPIEIKNQVVLVLQMENHFSDCEVISETDLNGLSSIFESGRRGSMPNLKVTLNYISMSAHCFDTKLYFRCSCNASCAVTVRGVSENCLLTTHAFSHVLMSTYSREELLSKIISIAPGCDLEQSSTSLLRPQFFNVVINKNTTTYPRFPDDKDNSPNACYMRNVQRTLENWVFTQGFYMKSYYRIPEGFVHYCRVVEPKRKGFYAANKKPKGNELPLLQLLMNLAGPDIRNRLVKGPQLESDNPVDVLVYTYKAYVNILRFVRGLDVYLPHVSSKLLLNYDQYCLYEKMKKFNDDPPMDFETFHSYSKQCWIDLILQIIKQFSLYRTVEPDDEIFDSPSMQDGDTNKAPSEQSQDAEEIHSPVALYSDHEKHLIKWLEECYEKERLTLWEKFDGIAPEKTIIFLDSGLRDGLMLGAATVRYCPYVKGFIRNMYTKARNPEEIFHNACTLVRTWKRLNFSYDITPFAITEGTMVDMLLLVTYLHEVLPSCYPQDHISIQAPLTQSHQISIVLENMGDNVIFYQVMCFGNDQKLFHIAKENFTIAPRKKKLVRITYRAKFVATAEAAVLFSGETPGQKYAKSIAINVEGTADVSYTCIDIPITVNLYKPCEVTLNIESPFKVKAEYAVYFGYQTTSSKDLYAWDVIKRLKIVRECLLTSDIYDFDENGMRTTKPIICCFHPDPKKLLLYYTNPEVGDWAVQLSMKGKVTESNFEYIYVTLPKNYEKTVCRCKDGPDITKNCPSIIYVKLPAKNNMLWDARKAMMLQYVEGAELKFWERRIYTPVGTRILALIMSSETHPLKQVMDEPVEYEVVLAKDSPFVTVKSVVIEDIISEGHVALPIHPIKNLLEVNTNSILKLVAKNEKRFYRLFFKRTSKDKVDLTSVRL